MKNTFLLVLSFILSIVLISSKVCPDISFSSNSTKYKDDMVKNGITVDKWTEKTSTPIIINSHKQIDYIYVIVNNHLDDNLNISNFKLSFDDKVYAKSTFKLDTSHPTPQQTEFAVEINYLCNEYGGALINYQLSINISDCGESEVHWKKVCGNPLLPRDGFSVDIQTKIDNTTIVQNGKTLNNSYFDIDIQNYVIMVPIDQNKTTLYLYMDNNSFDTNDTNPAMKVLKEIMKLNPDTKYSKIKIDADETLLTAIVEGPAINGGFISTEKSPISVEFQCKGRKGNSLVELNIPLDYFKDIDIFFIKTCDGVEDFAVPATSSGFKGLIFWVFLVLVLGCAFGACYNVFVNNKKSLDAVPGLEKSIKTLLAVHIIRESIIGKKLNEFNQVHFHALKGSNEPEESEFKIENLSEMKKTSTEQSKYGTI